MPPESRQEQIEETRVEPTYCADTGQVIPEEQVGDYYNDQGEHICEEASEDYVECYESGDIVHIDDACYSDNVGEYFSQDAYDDRFRYCEECDAEIDTEKETMSTMMILEDTIAIVVIDLTDIQSGM